MTFSSGTPNLAALKDVVRYFWEVDRDDPYSLRETIIPKGNVEIIFNLYPETAIDGVVGDLPLRVPRCFISGFHTVPIHLKVPGRQRFFGVYIHPAAFRKLFKVTVIDFANKCIDLTLVDSTMNSLWHKLAEEKSFDDRTRVFSSWLMLRLPSTSRHEMLFNDFLSCHSRAMPVTELSRWLCYSPRHLSRKLQALTGMNLEQTLLYKKYLQGIELIHHSQHSLSEIAHECSFSDQAHFSRTFKSYARLSPNEYRSLKSHISGHIFQLVR
jgi:AraC-like DNA-binding protein